VGVASLLTCCVKCMLYWNEGFYSFLCMFGCRLAASRLSFSRNFCDWRSCLGEVHNQMRAFVENICDEAGKERSLVLRL
jgi:hypothetical protein